MRLFRAVAATFALLASADAGDVGVKPSPHCVRRCDRLDDDLMGDAQISEYVAFGAVWARERKYVFEGNRLLREIQKQWLNDTSSKFFASTA